MLKYHPVSEEDESLRSDEIKKIDKLLRFGKGRGGFAWELDEVEDADELADEMGNKFQLQWACV